MKILAVYRHYPPDTAAYSRILRELLVDWSARGHEVTVLTGQPSYNDNRQEPQPRREFVDGVHVRRLYQLPEKKAWLIVRTVNCALFYLQALWFTLSCWGRVDLMFANTYPPLASGLFLCLVKALRGVPFVYHCQDLHPESLLHADKLGPGLLYWLLQKWDAFVCRHAARVVCLSSDMRATLAERGLDVSNVKVLNNFVVPVAESLVEPVRSLREHDQRVLRVLFAGNLGAFQGLEAVVDAARAIADQPIRFIFMGSGTAKFDLQLRAGELVNRTIFFEDFQPLEVAVASMRVADLLLVSLAPNIYKVAYPSKAMMYLASGKPLLALVESHSELACTIRQRNWGIVPRDRSSGSIVESLQTAWRLHIFGELGGEHIQAESLLMFGREQALERWAELLEQLPTRVSKQTPVASRNSQQQPLGQRKSSMRSTRPIAPTA